MISKHDKVDAASRSTDPGMEHEGQQKPRPVTTSTCECRCSITSDTILGHTKIHPPSSTNLNINLRAGIDKTTCNQSLWEARATPKSSSVWSWTSKSGLSCAGETSATTTHTQSTAVDERPRGEHDANSRRGNTACSPYAACRLGNTASRGKL